MADGMCNSSVDTSGQIICMVTDVPVAGTQGETPSSSNGKCFFWPFFTVGKTVCPWEKSITDWTAVFLRYRAARHL